MLEHGKRRQKDAEDKVVSSRDALNKYARVSALCNQNVGTISFTHV